MMQFTQNTGHRNLNMQHNSNITHRNITYVSLDLAQESREHLKWINVFERAKSSSSALLNKLFNYFIGFAF